MNLQLASQPWPAATHARSPRLHKRMLEGGQSRRHHTRWAWSEAKESICCIAESCRFPMRHRCTFTEAFCREITSMLHRSAPLRFVRRFQPSQKSCKPLQERHVQVMDSCNLAGKHYCPDETGSFNWVFCFECQTQRTQHVSFALESLLVTPYQLPKWRHIVLTDHNLVCWFVPKLEWNA